MSIMTGEKTIEVWANDFTGDRSEQIRLNTRRTIAQVRPQILERLAMPLEDDAGEPISYALFNDSIEAKPYLQDEQFVGEVLTEGQTVRAVPEIIAGV